VVLWCLLELRKHKFAFCGNRIYDVLFPVLGPAQKCFGVRAKEKETKTKNREHVLFWDLLERSRSASLLDIDYRYSQKLVDNFLAPGRQYRPYYPIAAKVKMAVAIRQHASFT